MARHLPVAEMRYGEQSEFTLLDRSALRHDRFLTLTTLYIRLTLNIYETNKI